VGRKKKKVGGVFLGKTPKKKGKKLHRKEEDAEKRGKKRTNTVVWGKKREASEEKKGRGGSADRTHGGKRGKHAGKKSTDNATQEKVKEVKTKRESHSSKAKREGAHTRSTEM